METDVLYVSDRFFDLYNEWCMDLCTCMACDFPDVADKVYVHHPACYFRVVMDNWNRTWLSHRGEEKQA